MKKFFILISKLAFVFTCSVSFAVENDKATSVKTLSSSPINGSTLLETVGGLILILAIIVFLAWLLRRTGQFSNTANGEMKIIAGLSLGTREKAVLLQVGEQQILVGVTPQHIQTLHILENNIVTPNKTKLTGSGFADKLQQIMNNDGENKS